MSHSVALKPSATAFERAADLEGALRTAPVANDSTPHAASTPLRRLTRAIQEHRVCVVRYASEPGGAVSTRAIEPLALTTTRGRLGVLAWCRLRHDLRTFRLDRVRELTLIDERFDDHPGVALERFIQQRRRDLP